MTPGWFNLLIFVVLSAVIILCSFNIATYNDIKNGNTNAPDITNGECIAMIVINSALLAGAVIALFYYIYQIYSNAVSIYFDENGNRKTTIVVKGQEVVGYVPDKPYNYNTPPVQMFLWVFSTFVFVGGILNLVNAYKLYNGSDTNATSVNGAFIAFSWIFVIVAFIYWGYTTIRTIANAGKFKEVKFFKFLNVAKTSLTEKATLPSIMPCDCSKFQVVKPAAFNDYIGKPGLKTITDTASKYNLK